MRTQALASLWGLQNIKTVESLSISDNRQLRSLGGLGGLETVQHEFLISGNEWLQSLSGLEGLQTAGMLSVSRNQRLESLTGLEGLVRVDGETAIFLSPLLTSLSGCGGLQSTQRLVISQNLGLLTLNGLQSLQTVEDELLISANTELSSLGGLESLQSAGRLSVYQNGALRTLAGLQGLTDVRSDIRVLSNPELVSLSGLGNLQSAGTLEVTENAKLASLAGLENLTIVRDRIFLDRNPALTSVLGLQGLRTAGQLWIYNNEALPSVAGLESLEAVENELQITSNSVLGSLAGLANLHSVGSLTLSQNKLTSLSGLEKLTSVRLQLTVSNENIGTLTGLENLSSVGSLYLLFMSGLTELTGLRSLMFAWGGVVIRQCGSLRSLNGLGALQRSAQLTVQDSPLPVLGSPFARGVQVDKVDFDMESWPRCITPHERTALVSAVGRMEYSRVPEATWSRWRSHSCGWGELFKCARGRPCAFTLADDSGSAGSRPSNIFVSEQDEGCGACPEHGPQSNVTTGGVVDLGYALADAEGGQRSICICSAEEVGPVAQLVVRGPKGSEGSVAVCSRGQDCPFSIHGEALEPTDSLVLANSCGEGSLQAGFTGSWVESAFLLRDRAAWHNAAPSLYYLCWRAPCTSAVDGHPSCPSPEENTHFQVGSVELHGAYSRRHVRVLGKELVVPNIGFGVLDGDRMRFRRTCGVADEDGLGTLDAVSSGMVYDFGALSPDRVLAGTHHLCWCQQRSGLECDAEGQFMAESGEVQILCPAGQEPQSSGRCTQCQAGRQQPEPGLEPCSECPPGQFSPDGQLCQECQGNTFAEQTGSSSCVACHAWEFSEAVSCSVAPAKTVLLTAFSLCVGTILAVLVSVIRRRLSVVDVSLVEGHTIVTIFRPHSLANFGRSSFPVVLRGTGHPGLDSPREPFRASVADPVRLELLTSQGCPIDQRLDTSMGSLTLDFPHDCYHLGPHIPIAFSLPLLVITAAGLGAVLAADADTAAVAAMGAAGAALVFTVISAVVRWWPRATPLAKRMSEFKLRLGKQVYHSTRTRKKGPERAIAIGKLHNLLRFFHDYILDRNAYYLDSNILKPLTSASQLSFAELVGAGRVEWFVSHFWGTPFEHFCRALRKHAELVCGEREWTKLRYWVCFCSNNQYHIAEELGSDVKESSFYVTLLSGHCQGTCMVLDDQVLPLTRIWCIFELLQTIKLERQGENFQGLLLCTSSGVLNAGNGSVDVAMKLAQKVADMDLATAQATNARDEVMIRTQVAEEMGSFDALNRFVCREVRSMLVHAQSRSNQQFAAVLAHLDEDIGNEEEEVQGQEPICHV